MPSAVSVIEKQTESLPEDSTGRDVLSPGGAFGLPREEDAVGEIFRMAAEECGGDTFLPDGGVFLRDTSPALSFDGKVDLACVAFALYGGSFPDDLILYLVARLPNVKKMMRNGFLKERIIESEELQKAIVERAERERDFPCLYRLLAISYTSPSVQVFNKIASVFLENFDDPEAEFGKFFGVYFLPRWEEMSGENKERCVGLITGDRSGRPPKDKLVTAFLRDGNFLPSDCPFLVRMSDAFFKREAIDVQDLQDILSLSFSLFPEKARERFMEKVADWKEKIDLAGAWWSPDREHTLALLCKNLPDERQEEFLRFVIGKGVRGDFFSLLDPAVFLRHRQFLVKELEKLPWDIKDMIRLSRVPEYLGAMLGERDGQDLPGTGGRCLGMPSDDIGMFHRFVDGFLEYSDKRDGEMQYFLKNIDRAAPAGWKMSIYAYAVKSPEILFTSLDRYLRNRNDGEALFAVRRFLENYCNDFAAGKTGRGALDESIETLTETLETMEKERFAAGPEMSSPERCRTAELIF